MKAPVIETEHLILRSHRLEDLKASVEMWADAKVNKFIGGKPSSEQQTWGRLLNYVGHWELMGFGYWALEEKKSKDFVGEAGFADFRRNMEPSIKEIPEIGWALVSKFHGKGYAKEALNAVIQWGDKHFKSRTVCIINPENSASLHLAKKFGYHEVQETSFNGDKVILFSRSLRE